MMRDYVPKLGLSVIKWTRNNRFWILATVVIPLSTVGYDYLETTSLYNLITGTTHLTSSVERLYHSQPGFSHGLFAAPSTTANEFNDLLQLVGTSEDFSENFAPAFILRMAVENAPYVNLPSDLDNILHFLGSGSSTKMILSTDFSPAVSGSCPLEVRNNWPPNFPLCKVRIIGNKFELEEKIGKRKGAFRINFNLALTLISITFAVYEKRAKTVHTHG